MWSVWVLLWKHSLMRKRRYIRTFFDYFSPLLYFVLIHLLCAPSKSGRHETVHYTEPVSYDDLLRQQSRIRVLYTPETDLTNQLMDEVGAKLNLKRLDHLPRERETGYYPFTNVTALSILEYSKDMSDEDAIIIFEDMESDTWPKKLNYTIRMKTNFMTNQYETVDPFDLGHHEYFGVQYEPFMRLQWAIDTSYLRLLTGANVGQRLILQEFPFAADHFDMNVVSTCLLAAFLLPFALTLTFIFLTGRLFEDKNSGMHELVKMVGVSWEDLVVSHVLDLVPHLLLYAVGGALFFKIDGLITRTGGGYIAAALALHFLTVVALAFVTVYVFNMTQYLELVTMAVYTGCLVGSMLTQKVKCRALALLSCLVPHDPFVRFWRALGSREMFGSGITISNMWSRNPTEQTSVAEVYLFMMLQILLLSMIAWYLSRVRPGKYGQALPWKFPFSKEYWYTQPKVEAAPEEAQFVREAEQRYLDLPVGLQTDDFIKVRERILEDRGRAGESPLVCEAERRYFEKAPAGLPVGIQINDVSKVYDKDRVLHGVNLTVYRGEITVLLGHNGAGKTTLINIITGLISATSGRVLVEGKDTVKQAKEVRKLIGLCPQENIFFPHLTVLEHTMFFAMLKGQTYSQSRTEAINLFSKLQLSGKADALPSALSGGMRRRAQLACAVAGAARVLVLDEPTSGLDVETRRELWDLLLSLRGDRTVLLTTHFMEEADALGDRIAALHHGRVRCHATAMFLKRAIGTGYRLSFTTIGAPHEAAITAAITAVVPDATVRDQRPNGVAYNLPAKDTARFSALFAALEDRRSELHIDTIGVGKSTLDEVFVELCSDDKPMYTEEPENTYTEPVHGQLTGAQLWARQFAVLMSRQWRYITSHLVAFLGIIAFVTLLLWAFTAVSNNNPFGMEQEVKPNADIALNLDLYAARPQRQVFVKVDEATFKALRRGYSGVLFEEAADVADAVLQIGRTDIQEYNKYLIGIELNDTHAKALYTTTVRHAAPVALNVLSNALAAGLLPGSDPRKLTARNHPLQGAFVPYQETKLKLPKQDQQILVWACNIAMVVLFYLCTFSRLPCLERAAGTRHALVLAGAPRALAWAATLLAQLAQALLACVLPVAVLAAAVDRDDTFNQPGFIWALCVLLVLGILAFLGLVYLASTLAGQSAASAVLAISAFLFSQITPNVPESAGFYYKLVSIPYIVMPPHTLTTGLVQLATVAQLNGHCNLNRDKCPALYGPGHFEAAKCCGSPPGAEPWGYWAPHDAAGWPMLILAGQALAYFVLTLLSDSGALERAGGALARAARPAPRFSDSVARAEAAYVEKAIQLPKKQIQDAILCHNLQKNYPGFCGRKTFFAVKGISFSVKKGECFGLLGVNGAGKSTTFRMLTGQASPTGGDIFANGHHLCERGAYMRTFSYCPQFAGVDEFLTGRQSLALLLTLRGLQAADVAAIADSWIEEVGLTPAADKPVSMYSGGMARRLAAAAALCQAGRCALLDEPTAGVDPVARRRMHRAMLRARRHRSLIIASHSLDEMEALCHRIGIMSGGELRALGSAAALKAQHAQGYSVVFKLSTAQDVTDSASKLDEFKGELHTRFTCELQDQHQSMLSYHVKESLRYSELFSHLEQLRGQFPALVEDYTVTETTLEEVFLALAKEARSPPAV